MNRFTLATATFLFSILAVGSASAAPTQDADIDSLREEYRQLGAYLGAKRRIDDQDLESIRQLREQLEAYGDDPRALTMHIQLSMWLGDNTRVDEGFSRLSSMSDDQRVWLAWARSRLGENRYDDAHTLLAERETDLAEHPATGLLMAQCLMARNRFDEAITILDSIPQEGLESDPRLRSQVTTMKSQANRWKPLWESELALREQEEVDGDLPVMQLVTSRGPITIMLFENQAPNTVANFVSLAEKEFYDGQRFHRVVPNFVAQSGDPNSRPGSEESPGSGGPGYTIPDEALRPDKRLHFAGVLAMAKPGDPSNPGRSKPNSAGSQWYITLEPRENLNAEYTVFGRVIDGQDVADRLRKDDEILAVKTISRREKDYIPTTIPDPDAPPPAETPADPADTAGG